LLEEFREKHVWKFK